MILHAHTRQHDQGTSHDDVVVARLRERIAALESERHDWVAAKRAHEEEIARLGRRGTPARSEAGDGHAAPTGTSGKDMESILLDLNETANKVAAERRASALDPSGRDPDEPTTLLQAKSRLAIESEKRLLLSAKYERALDHIGILLKSDRGGNEAGGGSSGAGTGREAHEEIVRLEADVAQRDSMIANLERRLKSEEDAQREVHGRLQALQSNLEGPGDGESVLLSHLRGELSAVLREYAVLADASATDAMHSHLLNASASSGAARLRELEEDLAHERRARLEAVKKAAGLEQEGAHLRDRLEAVSASKDRAAAEMEALQRRLASQEDEAASTLEAIREAEAVKRGVVQTKVARLTEQLAAANARLEAAGETAGGQLDRAGSGGLREQLREARSEREELEVRLSRTTARLETVSTQLRDTHGQLADTQEALRQAERENDLLAERLRSAVGRLEVRASGDEPVGPIPPRSSGSGTIAEPADADDFDSMSRSMRRSRSAMLPLGATATPRLGGSFALPQQSLDLGGGSVGGGDDSRLAEREELARLQAEVVDLQLKLNLLSHKRAGDLDRMRDELRAAAHYQKYADKMNALARDNAQLQRKLAEALASKRRLARERDRLRASLGDSGGV